MTLSKDAAQHTSTSHAGTSGTGRAGDVEVVRTLVAKLMARGYRPGPRMVADLVAIASRGEAGARQVQDRREGPHVARVLTELARVLHRRVGTFQLHVEQRLQAMSRFLCTWVGAAPALAREDADIAGLENDALRTLDSGSACAWGEWRKREELSFRSGGSAGFLRALAELESASQVRGASGWMDESIWNLVGGSAPSARGLDAMSRRAGGVENEAVRTPSGVFREVAPHGLPDEPSRIAPADLALLAGGDRRARALLAAKLAADSILVRFGAAPRPARRMPRVLVCLALFDTPDMYVQRPGCRVPDVDPVRELMVRTFPLVVGALGQNKAAVTLRVQRQGPFMAGDWKAGDLKDQFGRVRGMWRRPGNLLRYLQRNANWLFEDCGKTTGRISGPEPENYDAAYLLSFGEPAAGYSTEWTARSVVIVTADGEAAVRFDGPEVRESFVFDLAAPMPVAEAMVEALGLTIARLEAGDSATASVPVAEYVP
jgi:hypothetical protein